MLNIKDLSFSYSKNGKLFDSLDLELKKGNIYGLLGKNGAGKSTLLKIMCGLLYPKTGSVHIEAHDVSKREPIILSDIYMIPEEFDLPEFSIDQYVNNFSPFYSKFDHKLFGELMNELEVERSRNLKKLSYGQKKKFMIAFAIATKCSIILMDEPTNGLDIPSKSKFRKIIASTIDDSRLYIISTHQVRDLENLIDPIVIIEKGKIVFNHSIDTISSRLSFIKSPESDLGEAKIFHKEAVFGGHYLVSERINGEETPLDFELLFNAILSNQEMISKHLNK
ncbi:MAG: ABC transporter ATP-binding protein [Bacteroidales bacterium]|nr:ABC transporter ATP-binding protein [Bacteroidales bacterium]